MSAFCAVQREEIAESSLTWHCMLRLLKPAENYNCKCKERMQSLNQSALL